MAITIFLIASAFASSLVLYFILSNFVTPSTISATSSPNSFFKSLYDISVSSIKSCNSAAAIVSLSKFNSHKYIATCNGCVI